MVISAHAQINEQYKDIELIVNFPAHPHYNIAVELLPEFTKETGIKVKVDQLQYQAMRAKQALELSKPKGDYDLIAYVVTSRPDYVKMGKLYPLKVFFKDAMLADKNYHKEDIIKPYLDNIGYENNILYGLPFGAETSILGYRKDILKKYNLHPPITYKQLLQQACFINHKEKNIAGITSRGASGHHLTHAFLLHLSPIGGRILDHNNKPILNNHLGIQAAQTLFKLLACAPKNVAAYRFNDMKNIFLQGKSAFYLDSTILAGEVNNPKKSKVINKVGWAPHPMGFKKASQTGGFGLAIPKNGRHPKAAFLLMQWLTSSKIDKKIALMGGNPSRVSSHYDQDVIHKYPHIKTFSKAIKYADPNWRPIIPEWNSINKKIGTELSKAFLKQKTIPMALNDAALYIEKILKKSGYYD